MNTNRPSIGSWIANPIQNPNLLQGPIPGQIQAPVQASLSGQLADSSGIGSHTTTVLTAPNRNTGSLHIQAIPAGNSGQSLTVNTADLTATSLRSSSSSSSSSVAVVSAAAAAAASSSNIGNIIQEQTIKTTLTVHPAPTHGHQVHISSSTSQPHHTSTSITPNPQTVGVASAVATGMTITGTGVTTVTPTIVGNTIVGGGGGSSNSSSSGNTTISNSSGVVCVGTGNSNSVLSGGGTTTTVTPATTHQTPQQQQQFQRLKVEDALSYLDQVKFKFNNQPQVYNDFLDIMKEFKSQSIDTPGVIQRVSNLFRGHPELIVGFNTFLPPGYKIEMQSNDQVNVSMPSSTSILIIHNSTANSVTSTQQMLALPSSTPSQGTVHSTPHHTGVHLTTANALPGQIGKTIFSSSPSTQQTYLHNQNTSTSIRSVSSTDPHHTNITHGSTTVTPQLSGSSIDSNLTSNIQTIPIPVNISPSPGIIGSLGTGPGPGNTGGGGGTSSSGIEGSNLNVTSALGPGGDNNSTSAQPVEFNHAINYVNKIKNRFQGQPEVYKQFLEILHAYQKEQKCLKEGIKPDSKPLNESQVYAQVAKLFQNQEDLLQEFGQFLPDANAAAVSSSNSVFSGVSQNVNSNIHHGSSAGSAISTAISAAHHVDNLAAAHRAAANDHGAIVKKPLARPVGTFLGSNINSPMGNQMRKQIISIQTSPNKPKMTSLRDVSLAEAGKYGSLNEYAFFDKVRKALRSQEVYENFLRCLFLYNHEIVSRNELVLLVTPFLGKFPELLKFFKDFLGYKDGNTTSNSYYNFSLSSANNNNMFMEGLPQRVVGIRERDRERMNEGSGAEINYATCKRYGASYRALPKNYVQPECSGRTALFKEVLNDTWVSFPSWSEDSTFVTSKKTQYEEFIYRCEDERFELDVIIETNLSTIRVLEAVQKRLSRMGPEERAKFKLDECLGGTSAIIHQRSIRRIYGDKSNEIIDGLKKNPVVAVPLVLKRLKTKEEEWKDAQKQFNKIWREQCEKYYLKSLDHQGISFKQNDIKYIRSKSLINEIETFYEERHEQNEENMASSGTGNNSSSNNNNVNGQNLTTGPHMTLTYKNKSMIEEACNLIIHHVKRQTSIHKEDKQKIKQLLKHFIPDMFATQRGDLSDDELEDFEIDKRMDTYSDNNNRSTNKDNTNNSVICIPVNFTNTKDNNGNNNNDDNGNGTNENNKTKSDTENNFNNNVPPISSSLPSTTTTSISSSATSETTITTITTTAPITATTTATTTMTTTNTLTATTTNNNNGQSCVNGNPSGQSKNVNPMLNKDCDDNYSLFFVNNYWYLFFRLHYILCDRLAQMHDRTMILIAEEEKEKTLRKESTAAALRLKPKNDYEVEEYFLALIDMVKQVLDGNLDFNQFEDQLREMFGIHAYIAFTLDKVVQNIVRQLQHIVGDETCITCNEMFIEESKNNATGGPCSTHHLRANFEAAYQKKAEQLLAEENCFKIIVYKGEGKVTIELICPDSVESEDGGEVEKWSEYVEKYVKEVENDISDELKEKLSRKPVFLPRNLRIWRYKESKEKEERAAAELGVIPLSSSPTGGRSNSRTASGGGGDDDGGTKDEAGETNNSLQAVDDTQCKFNVNSFKMVFVVQSESYLYKRNALTRARKNHKNISRRLHLKFDQFHQNWLEKSVTNEQRDECEEWLMGLNDENEDVTMKSIEEIKETPKEILITNEKKVIPDCDLSKQKQLID
ncbi:paired amphipathic helix protein Sin3a-like isoform X2 [Panonychus citri]|uniref:paired amphipathic helix protein Sin3a-like isoform X2 n=1 Tax=Panonychus citri TaxID=50023 RepID=UPI002306E455|nr:paired amphipathic helix protein Sin3a-like isoform X2 [Panonychus citri]